MSKIIYGSYIDQNEELVNVTIKTYNNEIVSSPFWLDDSIADAIAGDEFDIVANDDIEEFDTVLFIDSVTIVG